MAVDLVNLPLRMTTSEVCALGRISAATLRRRRRSGRYCLEPIDRGAEDIYSRSDVLSAFGLPVVDEVPAPPPPSRRVFDADAIRSARAAMRRKAQK